MRTSAEARKYWAEILRTDRFKQGIGYLEYEDNDGEKFNCCLGVLCRLYMEDGGELEIITKHDNLEYQINTVAFNTYQTFLPPEIQQYIGINSSFGRLNNGQFLSDLNDEGTSFAEIADIIDSEQLDITGNESTPY